MRFHIGFSKRIHIKTIIQFLGFLFVSLCAFFGISQMTVLAWTNTNVSGYDVHAYRPLYSNETDGTCSPSNYSGCTNQNQLYNATGCNNITKSGSTYCFFQNNNSSSYFSIKSMTCNNNSQCFAMANDTYGSNTTYRPRSMLVWRWRNTNVSWCTSGNIKLRFEMYLDSNNTVLNYTNLCAHNLNSITSSIGICSPLIKVNNSYYNGSNISSGTNTQQYEVTIPKPTTDLEIIVDDIQPFLAETGGEGGTYSNKTWNYGFRLVSYECTDTNSNQDTNAIISNDNQNTQSIINNQNNNTNNINQHIDNSATAIVDSIDDLKDNQDENTQEIIDSQKVCDSIIIDKTSVVSDSRYLNENGTLSTGSGFGVTDYISFDSIDVLETSANNIYLCYYDSSKVLLSCENTLGKTSVTIPQNAYYFRSSINLGYDRPQYKVYQCKNGNQAIYDSITDSNIDGMSESPFDTSWMGNYPTDIQTIMMYPINLLQLVVDTANNGTCNMLSLDLSPITQRWGGFDYVFRLPCMREVVSDLLGDWYDTFDTIIAWALFFYFCCNLYLKIEAYTSGVDMLPNFFINSRNRKTYVNHETGEIING